MPAPTRRPVGDGVVVFNVGFLVIHRIATAHAIDGVVRIHEGEIHAVADVAAVGGDGDLVAGAQEVGLGQVGAEHEARALLVAHAGADGAGGLLFHRVVDVDLVVFTRHARGFHGDALE